MTCGVSVYADVYRYRELFGSLFRRDIRAKYRGSVLGLGWSLLHPLVLMLVYLLVFSVLWRITEVGSDDYWLFLLCGLPAWVFFATASAFIGRIEDNTLTFSFRNALASNEDGGSIATSDSNCKR